MINIALLISIGLSGGILVGTSIASFITILEIVPRIAEITKTKSYIQLFKNVFIISVSVSSISNMLGVNFLLNKSLLMVFGVFFGTFIGLLAAALAEVLNVLPIIGHKFGINNLIYYLIMALALGKIGGSLFQWILM